MKRNRIVLSLLFGLVCIEARAIEQSENCSSWWPTKQNISSDFMVRALGTSALVATLVPPLSLLIRFCNEKRVTRKKQSLGPIATAFVRFTLTMHGYSPAEYTPFTFCQGDCFECCQRIISVPFNDEALIAIIGQLAAKDRRGLLFCLVQHGLELSSVEKYPVQKLKIPRTYVPFIRYAGCSCEESKQIFFKKILIDFQAAILHEMSHALHNDTGLIHFGLIFGCIPLLWKLDKLLITLFSSRCVRHLAFPSIYFLLYKLVTISVGKFCETRADKEVVKRARYALLLKTQYEYYKNVDNCVQKDRLHDATYGTWWRKLPAKMLLQFPWIDELTDEHPRHSRRARYFERAYRMFISQQKEINAPNLWPCIG